MTRGSAASSSSVGSRDLGHVAVDRELEAGRRDDLVDGHARVHRAQAHPVVGRLEVEHAEVRDDAHGCCGSGRPSPSSAARS